MDVLPPFILNSQFVGIWEESVARFITEYQRIASVNCHKLDTNMKTLIQSTRRHRNAMKHKH